LGRCDFREFAEAADGFVGEVSVVFLDGLKEGYGVFLAAAVVGC